jgi:hypothetical protein
MYFKIHLGNAMRPHRSAHVAGFWRLLTVREGRQNTFLPRPGAADGSAAPTTAHSFAELEWRHWLVELPEAVAEQTAEAGAEGDTILEAEPGITS